MVRPLGPNESLGSIRKSRWAQCPQRSWLRGVVSLPRRQPTSRAAPYAHLSVASGVPLVLGWSHTVTSGAYHGASLWFTTLCALSVALGALSYNLMAVLAEFFHFDRRMQHVQARTYLHGVDVTHSRFFQLPSVLAAVEFAAAAHGAQRRKTGEPYVTHCIETALIVEACLPAAHNSAAEQERHVYCIMAAVLHDVIDDTPVDLGAMQSSFGPRVAALVNQVSKLSQMNQLLRRGKRQGWAQYSPDHFKQLRKLIVDLAFEEPLVILVKLADRLHNMRTVYVLPPDKQRSVAEETLEVWCSMAESLGWDGLKSEMEDLCFAVLQPSTYCTLRAELDRLWSLPTLAVVEEQLGEQDRQQQGPGGEGGGGGGGDDGLGLRIVQVAGPEAPVRHYTRAAGVRAAAAAAGGGSAGGDSGGGISGYGLLRQQRRQRQRQREVSSGRGRRGEEAETEEAARERAQAVEAAVAAAAVPLPAPFSPAMAAVVPAAAPAMAVTAVASSSCSTVAVWGAGAAGDADLMRGAGGAAVGASSAAATRAVAVAVADEDAPASTSRGLPYSDGDASSSDGDGASSHAQPRPPSPSPASVAAAANDALPYALPYTSTSSSGASSAPSNLPKWATLTVRHSGSAPDGGESASDGSLRLDDATATAAAAAVSRSGTAADADFSGVPQAGIEAFPMTSYGTLESVDGPLLLDGLVLPFGLTAAAAAAGGVTADGSSSSNSSDSGGGGGGERVGQPAAASGALVSAAAAAPDGSAADAAGVIGAVSSLSDRPPLPSAPLSPLSPQQERLKLILSTVVPFESVSFKNLRGLPSSARRGLDVLDECAALLYNEIQIRSQAGGLGINIQGRLKSLHSVYRKMVRKNVAVAQVYDSRALRVIVDDGEGHQLREAVDVCYRLVGAVHSIWKPIKREFDDYIANPKQSGYQALHTAVRGPGGIPMEVQIKTSSMHELAEYGAAAHWVYKEYTPVLQSPSAGRGRAGGGGGGGGGRERLPVGYVGQPLLKVSKDKLRYGVVVSRSDDGQRLLAAVKLGATFRPFPTRVPDYGFYSGLLDYARAKGWPVPGHGDLMLRLEEFVQCDDGRYHRRDHLGYLIPAETITLLEGFEEDAMAAKEAEERQAAAAAAAAAAAPAAAAEAGSAAADADGSGGAAADALRSSVDEEALAAAESSSAEQRRFREQMRVTFAKTQQLRSMIAWGEGAIGKYAAADYQSDEVSVLIWPGGRIEHFARGTTAGDIVAEKGLITTGEGYDGYRVNLLINVNNRLVPEDTVLNDGDLVILAREKVRI